MELGAFSVSLAVNDIKASREFYTKFGFRVIGGDATENWLILQNGAATIGLFQGMFEKNILVNIPHNPICSGFLSGVCRHLAATEGTVHRSPQVIGGDVDVEGRGDRETRMAQVP